MTSTNRTVIAHRQLHRHIALLLLFLTGIASCADGDDIVRQASTEERYKEAMEAFADEDYETSRKLFEAIVLQDPASELADDAQFYLAESYFLNDEYHLAAYAYNRVRSFPNSPYYKLAVFRTGDSYYHSAGTYDRDQKEIRAAIDHFRSFANAYAGDSLANVAQTRISELRGRLARRDYETAQTYMKLDDPTAALVYFSKVLEEFTDTEYYALAVTGKLEAFCELERATEAKTFADSLVLARPNEPGTSPARTFQSTGCR